MLKSLKRYCSIILAAALLIASVNVADVSASKIGLSKKTLSLKVGSSYTLKVTGVKKATWKVNKSSVVKLSSKKKKSVKLTAKKEGKATVTASYKVKKKTKKLTCKVTVTAADTGNSAANNADSAKPADNNSQAQNTSPTAEPTPVPTATPIPTAVPTASVKSANNTWAYIPVDDDSLLKELGPIFGNVGTCLTYEGVKFNGGTPSKIEMQEPETMTFVKNNYNSFTLENEMKPDYLLADAINTFRNPPLNATIYTDDAKAQGYVIPEGYTEDTVPTINYQRIDDILKVAAEYGVRMRAHTLIWHSQTPTAFFRTNYSANGSYVSPAIMDQRINYYVSNVMKHVIESEYSDVVYAWDVVNEYFHQSTSSDWASVYNIVSGGRLTDTPSYVKVAFKAAHDMLKKYNLTDKVSLFYNDYNTSEVSTNIVNLFNYINSKDDINPDGEKICSGVGMQSHLDVKWPTVNEQLQTAKKFLDSGCEIQITELDIINSVNEGDEETLCDYWYNFIKGLVAFRMDGANITGITFWGLSDKVTWRFGKSALLYGQSINEPKKSLYAVFAAAQTSWDI